MLLLLILYAELLNQTWENKFSDLENHDTEQPVDILNERIIQDKLQRQKCKIGWF